MHGTEKIEYWNMIWILVLFIAHTASASGNATVNVAVNATETASRNATVTLPNYGKLIGSTNVTTISRKNIYQFFAIKFAESPTGSRRFKAPVTFTPSKNDSQYAANEPGRPCPAFKNVWNSSKTELIDAEDCLHLSVYSTNLTASRPVMVYIHGGSFSNGAATNHPPHYLLERDVVLVVPQYRLGPFGFLSTQSDEIPGNAGVLDILKALEWIQTNIVHFGGNTNKVTLFGQSAGASIIGSILLSPSVPPNLFHKVILQSGAALNSWSFDYKPVDNARDIATRLGCNMTSMSTINKCFMDIEVLPLLTAFTQHATEQQDPRNPYGGIRMTFGPMAPLFPYAPDLLIDNIAQKNISILGGTTKHDGTFILAAIYDALLAHDILKRPIDSLELIDIFNNYLVLKEPTGTLSAFIIDKLFTKEQMRCGNFTDMIDGFVDMCTIAAFKAPILQTLQANLKSSQPSFLYTFDYEGEHTRFGENENSTANLYPFRGGVHHSNDNIYLFPWPEFVQPLNKRDRKFSKKMLDLWTSFADYSVPISNDCVFWPKFTNPSGPYMHINERCVVGKNYVDEFDVAVREKFHSSFGTTLTSSTVLMAVTGLITVFSYLR